MNISNPSQLTSALDNYAPQPGFPGAPANNPPSDKDTFLSLLVAQLRYQNPLEPADGMQFVTQLAQFTQLEQSTQMREDLAAIRKALEAAPATAASGIKTL